MNKPKFHVILRDEGQDINQFLKATRGLRLGWAIPTLRLRIETEGCPMVLKSDVSEKEANQIKAAMEAVGASIRLLSSAEYDQEYDIDGPDE